MQPVSWESAPRVFSIDSTLSARLLELAHEAGTADSTEGAAGSASPDLGGGQSTAPARSPARGLLWGHSVDLEEVIHDGVDAEKMLSGLSWEFILLALGDKTELPVTHPKGSARVVGLRFYLDALERLSRAGVLDASARRYMHGLRKFWDLHKRWTPAEPQHIVQWLREAPIEEGIRSPLVCVFWITGFRFSHYQGISLRCRDDGDFDVILVDLSPPNLEMRLLGQREAASYLFRSVREADLLSFLGSPLGQALLGQEDFFCSDCYEVTHRMDFYLGPAHPICYPWALQQLQWSNSCCPKSLSALLRNEYTLTGEPSQAIDQLYRYKKIKGLISRELLRLMEEIAEAFPQHLGEIGPILSILRERAELRCRYYPLEQAIAKLELSPEAQSLVVIRTLKAVAALLEQSKQLPRSGSPDSWDRYVTLQAPIAKATLTNLTHVLANLAVAQRWVTQADAGIPGIASTVAMAVVHWGDRMIRPLDEGAGGSILAVPERERRMLDLRARICYSAKKNIKEVQTSERQQLKRFFKVLADPRWGKAPSRSLSRVLIGESPAGSMRESDWASIAPLPESAGAGETSSSRA